MQVWKQLTGQMNTAQSDLSEPDINPIATSTESFDLVSDNYTRIHLEITNQEETEFNAIELQMVRQENTLLREHQQNNFSNALMIPNWMLWGMIGLCGLLFLSLIITFICICYKKSKSGSQIQIIHGSQANEKHIDAISPQLKRPRLSSKKIMKIPVLQLDVWNNKTAVRRLSIAKSEEDTHLSDELFGEGLEEKGQRQSRSGAREDFGGISSV